MIELTKLNYDKFFINPNLVEIVEHTPDTMITTISGKKYHVLESVDEVTDTCIEYYMKIHMKNFNG